MAIGLANKVWCSCQGEYQMDYICDTEEDFKDLPKATTGSCAICIATGEVKMVNTAGEWVDFGG